MDKIKNPALLTTSKELPSKQKKTNLPGIFLFYSTLPALNLFFAFIIKDSFCSRGADFFVLYEGLLGLCELYSFTNIILALTRVSDLFIILGVISLIVSGILYSKKKLELSKNKLKICIFMFVALQYILYLYFNGIGHFEYYTSIEEYMMWK